MKIITKRVIEEKIGRAGRKEIARIASDRDVEHIVLLESPELSRYKILAVGSSFEIDTLEAAEEFASGEGWRVYGYVPADSPVNGSGGGEARVAGLFSSKAKQQLIDALEAENTALKKKLTTVKSREASAYAELEKLRAHVLEESEDLRFVRVEKVKLADLRRHLEDQESQLQMMEDAMAEKMHRFTVREAELDQREDDLALRERAVFELSSRDN